MEPLVDVFGTQTSAAGLSFGLRGIVDRVETFILTEMPAEGDCAEFCA